MHRTGVKSMVLLVAGMGRVSSEFISAGYAHTCAIKESDNTAECWGSDGEGQSTPPNSGATAYSSISAGEYHTCAIKQSDNTAECWGYDHFGRSTPPNSGTTAYSSISAGRSHTCAIKESDNTAECFTPHVARVISYALHHTV